MLQLNSESHIRQACSCYQESNNRATAGSMVQQLHQGCQALAPELLVGESQMAVATFDDLKRADICTLGMTLMVLLNPCCKYTYSEELQDSTSKEQSKLQSGSFVEKKATVPRTSEVSEQACNWLVYYPKYIDPKPAPHLSQRTVQVPVKFLLWSTRTQEFPLWTYIWRSAKALHFNITIIMQHRLLSSTAKFLTSTTPTKMVQ